MSVSVTSMLLYGATYSDLYDDLDDEGKKQLDEDLDYGDIEAARPYYDANREEWFVGYELVDDFDLKGVRAFLDSLEEAENYFKNRWGVTGTVRACKSVC